MKTKSDKNKTLAELNRRYRKLTNGEKFSFNLQAPKLSIPTIKGKIVWWEDNSVYFMGDIDEEIIEDYLEKIKNNLYNQWYYYIDHSPRTKQLNNEIKQLINDSNEAAKRFGEDENKFWNQVEDYKGLKRK